MRDGWKKTKLGDVCYIRRGSSPRPIKNYLTTEGGMPWVKIGDATQTCGKYINSTAEQIKWEGVSKSVIVNPGDLILSNSGTAGLPMFMGIRACIHDGWQTFRELNGIDKEYLYYYLLYIRHILLHNAYDSVMKNLTLDMLRDYEILLPPIEEQKSIVDILLTIDNKIANNEAINRNLYEQISLLCKAWLTDYVPFGGVCPDDWKMTSLEDIADFVSGYSYKGKELTEQSNIAMATIKNFDRNGGFKLNGYKDIVPSDKLKSSQHVDLFDTLVAHTDLTQNAEVIGNAEMVLSKSGYDELVFSMDLVKVLPKNGNLSKFLIAALLRDDKFKQHCLGYVNGTTVLHLSKKALPAYELLLPKDLSVLAELDEALSVMYKRISCNIEENVHLEDLRDTLLPKLMSGELDVSDLDI